MNHEMQSLISGTKTQPQPESFHRGTSSGGEPGEVAYRSLGKDLQGFKKALTNANGDVEGGKLTNPLPPSHWINQEVEDGKTLLLAALDEKLPDYTEALLKAGALASQPSNRLATNPLHRAVKSGHLPAVKLLLDENNERPANKADVNLLDTKGRAGLHLAVEQEDLPIIQFLLAQKNVEVDVVDIHGRTPLYFAAKQKSGQLVRLLLENGASLDAVCDDISMRQHISDFMPDLDISGITVKVAPMVRDDRLARLAKILDTASFNKGMGLEVEEELLTEFSRVSLGCSSESLSTFQSSRYTLLQKCASSNLADFAEVLLKRVGFDARHQPVNGTSSPVLLAASRGDAELLDVLKKYKANFTCEDENKETVLHKILQKDENLLGNVPQETLEKALDVLLSESEDNKEFKTEISRLVNRRDGVGNTPLHYATQKWSEKTVRRLLERGANIGIKNKWNEIPINRISSSTMQSFLDEFCLQSEKDVNHDEFKVTFDYQFLAPPVDSLPTEVQGPYSDKDETQKASDGKGGKKFALPETESLWYMAESKEHRHLLKHPVITSFLWCKWTRIRRFVNRNLRFYMFFVMLLTWFIFQNYGGKTLKSEQTDTIPAFYGLFVVFSCIMFFLVTRDWVNDVKDKMRQEQIVTDSDWEEEGMRPPKLTYCDLVLSNWLEFLFLASLVLVLVLGVPLLSWALSVLTALLAGREMFQMTVSLRRYVFTLENWVEVAMVGLVSFLLFAPDEDSYELKRQLAGICLLLSWAELITFAARHPRLTRYNVYVTMFLNVLKTFAFFLLWYVFYILAFGMGFYIMLHKVRSYPVSKYVCNNQFRTSKPTQLLELRRRRMSSSLSSTVPSSHLSNLSPCLWEN